MCSVHHWLFLTPCHPVNKKNIGFVSHTVYSSRDNYKIFLYIWIYEETEVPRMKTCFLFYLWTLTHSGHFFNKFPVTQEKMHYNKSKGAVILTFFTFWGITTHLWHPKGPRIWKLAKKIFQLHAWPAEIFGKNWKMRFFGMISQFNFRSRVWQIFTIFSACFIYGILNTHTKF